MRHTTSWLRRAKSRIEQRAFRRGLLALSLACSVTLAATLVLTNRRVERTAARLADAAKAEADAGAGSGTVVRRTTETVVVAAPAPVAEEPCPECGDTGPRRHETRRIAKPDGGRGSVMARVAVCGACGTALGVA